MRPKDLAKLLAKVHFVNYILKFFVTIASSSHDRCSTCALKVFKKVKMFIKFTEELENLYVFIMLFNIL